MLVRARRATTRNDRDILFTCRLYSYTYITRITHFSCIMLKLKQSHFFRLLLLLPFFFLFSLFIFCNLGGGGMFVQAIPPTSSQGGGDAALPPPPHPPGFTPLSEVLYKTNSEWSLFVQWNNILHSVKDETLHSTRLRLVEYSVSYLSPRAKSCTIALMTIHYLYNNPLLVMAKIKLIESFRSIKHTTIQYNGLKIRLLLTGSIAPKSIRQLIVVIFPLKDIFKPPF